MAELNFDRFTKALEGPVYVAVGAGVLGFQRAQVLRRSLERRLMKLAWPVVTRQVSGAVSGARPEDLAGRVVPLAAGAARRFGPGAYGMAEQAAGRLGQAAGDAAGRLGPVLVEAAGTAAARVRPIAAQMGDRLPPEARELIDAAGALAADIPVEAEEVVKEAAAFGRLALHVLRAPLNRPGYP
jgi:hypothetical protein